MDGRGLAISIGWPALPGPSPALAVLAGGCHAGTSSHNCGTGGGLCQTCGADTSCQAGVCL